MSRTEVTVLGAGVIGLTIAYQLSSRSDLAVKVVSKCFPDAPAHDYTSQYAGANWRSVCANTDIAMMQYEKDTLLYLRDFADKHPDLVRKCKAVDYFDPREPDVHDARIVRKTDIGDGELPWFAAICPEFRVLDTAELSAGAAFAVEFGTVTINAPAYVRWLQDACRDRGVSFEQRAVSSLADAQPVSKGGVLVNATGLAARELVPDAAVYATRGQTVLVRNSTGLRNTLSRVGQDYLSYLIPRPGGATGDEEGLIIGGCQQPHNEDYAVDQRLAADMLQWAREKYPGVFPPEHAFEVLKHNVGMRPSRRGGVRVEIDSDRRIVHSYGIGGWGYQSSWGIALRACALVDELIASRSQ